MVFPFRRSREIIYMATRRGSWRGELDELTEEAAETMVK